MKKSKWVLFLVSALILGLLLISGCANGQNSGQANANNTIKFGGSSTLAPILAKCADDFTEEFKTWQNVDSNLPDEPIVIFVSTGGSGFGVKSALDGTFDFGMVTRDLSADEEVSFSDGTIVQLGSDVLDVAVNYENPLTKVKTDLSIEEIISIFSGEINSWSELDETLPERPIVVAVRDLGGGASIVFDDAIMKGTPISTGALQLPSMGALGGKIMDNADTIGYVSSGLVNQNPDKLIPLSVDGIAPTIENINSGKYNISRPLLLVSPQTPDKYQAAFINYLKSDKGLKVVEDLGYVAVGQ
ncbi:MAG TPA: phosphate ABC transporter substrate-binding protein [Syntrophomonadaceae bacterium]|nr:phosphate ABC transporter substrate-binding protein [Syntrophomonadaceae bacterium]